MAKRKRPGNALASTLKRIRLFATDVDGVLTDAGMYYSESGEELKKFNTRDGMGIKLLQRAGIEHGRAETWLCLPTRKTARVYVPRDSSPPAPPDRAYARPERDALTLSPERQTTLCPLDPRHKAV